MPDSGAVHAAAVAAAAAAATTQSNGPPRYFKRRRVDGSLDDADPLEAAGDVVNSGEAYALPPGRPDWNPDIPASSQPHSSHKYPRTSSTVPAAASAAAAAADPGPPTPAATAGSAPALSEGSSWQASDPSSYPDLASYQQQPYFYSTTASSTPYNSSWPPPPSEPAQSSYGTSPSFPVDDQSAAAGTMPYFPTSHSNAVAAADSHHDVASGFQPGYVGVDNPSNQFAFAGPDAAVGQDPSSSALISKQSPPPSSSSMFYFDDASMHLKIQSLPILDNLATQLIHTISKASYPQIQELMRRSDSEDSQAYKTLKNLFDQTRKVYSRETSFIDAIAIQMFQPNQQEIIRKANIATFISSILGAHDVSFFHLNEFFMETFVPLGHRLLKWQGAVFLELKTQIYISALINSDRTPEDMLDELFPLDLDAQILTRHPDAPSLSPSEQDFINRSRQRKSYLLAKPSSKEALKELPKKYAWHDFVREFASCINKNVDAIVNIPARSQNGSAAAAGGKNSGSALSDSATNLIMRGAGSGSGGNNPLDVASLTIHGRPSSRDATSGPGPGSGPNDPSAPRKSAPAPATIRQPWTKPEEDALLAGLERVNGPHWSQILALYGRGGSVSEVLKDRNQVQLKDKARNLKLWYLKTGKDVPPSLQGVTGELRKRGGARARAALGLTDGEEGAGKGDNGEESGEGRGKKKAAKR